jgi:hypothetical protein
METNANANDTVVENVTHPVVPGCTSDDDHELTLQCDRKCTTEEASWEMSCFRGHSCLDGVGTCEHKGMCVYKSDSDAVCNASTALGMHEFCCGDELCKRCEGEAFELTGYNATHAAHGSHTQHHFGSGSIGGNDSQIVSTGANQHHKGGSQNATHDQYNKDEEDPEDPEGNTTSAANLPRPEDCTVFAQDNETLSVCKNVSHVYAENYEFLKYQVGWENFGEGKVCNNSRYVGHFPDCWINPQDNNTKYCRLHLCAYFVANTRICSKSTFHMTMDHHCYCHVSDECPFGTNHSATTGKPNSCVYSMAVDTSAANQPLISHVNALVSTEHKLDDLHAEDA